MYCRRMFLSSEGIAEGASQQTLRSYEGGEAALELSAVCLVGLCRSLLLRARTNPFQGGWGGERSKVSFFAGRVAHSDALDKFESRPWRPAFGTVSSTSPVAGLRTSETFWAG